MATRETRRQMGHRRGEDLARGVVTELRTERQVANVSQRAIASELGWHQAQMNRLEQFDFMNVSLVRLAEIAAVLGLELSVRVHRIGDPVRDRAPRA